MTGIGVVFNARAGRNRRDPGAHARLARQLGDHGVVAAPRSVDELFRVAEDFRAQKIEVLGIAGGDGTNQVTLTNFRRVYGADPLPTVALLRGGTMNTVADSIGVPRDRTDGLLDRLVRRYLETPRVPAVEQWTLDVEGKLGFLWGVGVVANFLDEYYATGAPSPWTAVKTLSRAVGSTIVGGPLVRRMTRPVRAEVLVDDGDARWGPREFLTVAAATIADIGLGFRPFHRAREARGAFQALGIHTSALGFVLDLPRIHAAQPMRPGKTEDRLARRLVVRTAGPTIRYMIDGDVLEHPASEMTVQLGPSIRLATMN